MSCLNFVVTAVTSGDRRSGSNCDLRKKMSIHENSVEFFDRCIKSLAGVPDNLSHTTSAGLIEDDCRENVDGQRKRPTKNRPAILLSTKKENMATSVVGFTNSRRMDGPSPLRETCSQRQATMGDPIGVPSADCFNMHSITTLQPPVFESVASPASSAIGLDGAGCTGPGGARRNERERNRVRQVNPRIRSTPATRPHRTEEQEIEQGGHSEGGSGLHQPPAGCPHRHRPDSLPLHPR